MRALLVILLVAIPLGPAFATKTDVVVMINGDRITCEIKKLEQGKLTVKTDDLGDLQIKWDKIARLTSRTHFLVRTGGGSLHYGALTEPDRNDVLIVTSPDNRREIPLADVRGLDQVKDVFWDKIELELSLGFNYTQATSVTQLYYGGAADYRGRVHGFGLSLDGNVTDKGEGSETFRRYDARTHHTRRITGRLWSDLNLGGQRNDELGLRLRLLGGAGLGYRVLESSHSSLIAGGGLNVTREWSRDESDAANNLEGRIGVRFDIFAYDTPKTSVRVEANVFPNFTQQDRVRSQLDVSGRREVVKDLFIELKYYRSGDTRPPTATAAKVDQGVMFSVGWSK